MERDIFYLTLFLLLLLFGNPTVTNARGKGTSPSPFPTTLTSHAIPQPTEEPKGLDPKLVFIYGTAGQEIFLKNGSTTAAPIIRNASAQYMTFDELSETLYWSGTPLNTTGDEQTRIFQVRLKNGNVTASPTVFATPFHDEDQGTGKLSGPVQIKWLEYDWLGDNIYFVDLHRGICLCSRNSSCAILVNESAIGGVLKDTKIALDPERGSLYWSTQGGPRATEGGRIVTADMDGTNATVIVPNVIAKLLTVDRQSGLLVWQQQSPNLQETHADVKIVESGLDGKPLKNLANLSAFPLRLRTAGDDVFFFINASLHAYKRATKIIYLKSLVQNFDRTQDFYVYMSNPKRRKPKSPCDDRLCAHICVPKPSMGELSCLCPTGFKLLLDNRSCEEIPKQVSTEMPSMETPSTEIPSTETPSTKAPSAKTLSTEMPPTVTLSLETPAAQIPEGTAVNTSRPVVVTYPNVDSSEIKMQQDANKTGSATFNTSPDSTDMKRIIYLAAGAGGGAIVLLGLIAITILKFGRKARELRNLTAEESSMFLSGDASAVSDASDGVHRAILMRYTRCIHPDSIQIENTTLLGTGAYSLVHKGKFDSKPVAVKTMRPTIHIEEFKAILAEVKAMAYVKGHANVVKFLGADVSAIKTRKIAVVTELSPTGSLSHCLSEAALDGFNISPLKLVQYCEQMAAGMEYLTSKCIIHGDLAARNVLVFDNNVVKIMGFGRCKHSFTTERAIKRRLRELSWRWASIELLNSLQFSEESDVWAFGVTVWEIFSFGLLVPYDGMKFNRKFTQHLEKGNRLTIPPCAPMAISQLLSSCWNWNPSNRPKFTEMREILLELLDRAYARSWDVSGDRLADAGSLSVSEEDLETNIGDVSLELTTSV